MSIECQSHYLVNILTNIATSISLSFVSYEQDNYQSHQTLEYSVRRLVCYEHEQYYYACLQTRNISTKPSLPMAHLNK